MADMNLKLNGEALRFQRERKVKYVLGLGHQATVHNYIKKCLKKLDKCFQVGHFCHKSLPGKWSTNEEGELEPTPDRNVLPVSSFSGSQSVVSIFKRENNEAGGTFRKQHTERQLWELTYL